MSPPSTSSSVRGFESGPYYSCTVYIRIIETRQETDLDLETFYFFFFFFWKPSETVGHRTNANFRVGRKREQRQTEKSEKKRERERKSAWPRDDINPRLLNGFMSQKRGMEAGEKENKEGKRRLKEKERRKVEEAWILARPTPLPCLLPPTDSDRPWRRQRREIVLNPMETFRFQPPRDSQPTRRVDIRWQVDKRRCTHALTKDARLEARRRSFQQLDYTGLSQWLIKHSDPYNVE